MSVNIPPKDLVGGLRENLVAYLNTLRVIPGVVIEETESLMRAATGVPAAFMNPVVTTGAIVDTRRHVSETDRFFSERGLPYAWYDLRDTHSAGLDEHLPGVGTVLCAEMPGMAAVLCDVDAGCEVPDLEIIVAGDDEMSMWNDITAEVYDVPEAVLADYSRFMILVNRIPEMTCYVGLLDGVPAASAMMLYSPHAAGIYSVATMPGMRNRGIGAAITAQAMSDARSDGYPMAVLEASQMGRPVYHRLGFKECCKVGLYMKL